MSDRFYIRQLRAELRAELDADAYAREHPYAEPCGEDDARERRIADLREILADAEAGS